MVPPDDDRFTMLDAAASGFGPEAVKRLENEVERLKGVIRAQESALAHWRREADRDAGLILRLQSELKDAQGGEK
jgi:hypothetical protein